MNIRLLRIFRSVCEQKSITKTAGLLYMTQPAVSLAIKELELETGLVLFDRLSRRLEITESGKLYLEKVNQLLDLCDELEQSPAELKKQTTLRIGCCITIACNWLPQIMQKFQLATPETLIQVSVGSAIQVMAMLTNNEIDLALYEGVPPGKPWHCVPFSQYRLTPVCSPEHPLAYKKDVPVDVLVSESLMLREPGSAIRDTFDSFLRLNHMIAHPIMTSINTQALVAAVSHGLGVSVLPDAAIADAIDKQQLAAFSVLGMELSNENSIVYHRNKILSDAMNTFIHCAGIAHG